METSNQIIEPELSVAHDNVMLLTMSTLPFNIAMNTYIKKEGDKEFVYKGLSQLEPHTKHVIAQLAQQNQRLNRIVILASKETREDRPEKWKGETAISFFEKRIRKFAGEDCQIENFGVEDSLTERVETIIPKDLYGDSMPEFIIVEMEDELFFWDAVQKILGNDKNRSIHLYMDMQGGDRNAVSQLNAIVTLLERQKVTICGRYSNDYEPKKLKPLHHIREASEEYRTYELITAMEIFTTYGWGDKLENYFGKMNGSSKEAKLLKAIKQASSAISMCNVENFDSAVQKIADLRMEFEASKEITQLNVVYENIKEEYELLFDAKYRYVEQIRWCIKKNFIQQALTIFEAKMPYEFVHSGMIYYLEKGEDTDEFLRECEKLYYGLSFNERYKMKDLNHYFVKYYQGESANIVKKYGLSDKEKIQECLKKYMLLCRMRNQINHASASQHNKDGFFLYMKNKHRSDKNWIISPGRNYKNEILQFLDEWENLADLIPETVKNKVEDMS